MQIDHPQRSARRRNGASAVESETTYNNNTTSSLFFSCGRWPRWARKGRSFGSGTSPKAFAPFLSQRLHEQEVTHSKRNKIMRNLMRTRRSFTKLDCPFKRSADPTASQSLYAVPSKGRRCGSPYRFWLFQLGSPLTTAGGGWLFALCAQQEALPIKHQASRSKISSATNKLRG